MTLGGEEGDKSKSSLVSNCRFNKNSHWIAARRGRFLARGESSATTPLLLEEDARAGDDRLCLASARLANRGKEVRDTAQKNGRFDSRHRCL